MTVWTGTNVNRAHVTVVRNAPYQPGITPTNEYITAFLSLFPSHTICGNKASAWPINKCPWLCCSAFLMYPYCLSTHIFMNTHIFFWFFFFLFILQLWLLMSISLLALQETCPDECVWCHFGVNKARQQDHKIPNHLHISAGRNSVPFCVSLLGKKKKRLLCHPSTSPSIPWEAPALVTLGAHPPAQAYKIDYSPCSLILKVTLGLTTRREQAAPNSKLILKVLQRDFALSLKREKRQSQYMMTYTRLGRISHSLSPSVFLSFSFSWGGEHS